MHVLPENSIVVEEEQTTLQHTTSVDYFDENVSVRSIIYLSGLIVEARTHI